MEFSTVLFFHISMGSFFLSILSYPFNVHSNEYSTDGICLIYDVSTQLSMADGSFDQIVSYCLRDPVLLHFLAKESFDHLFNQNWTFDKLQAMNVTADNLFEWSASVEEVERYQMYLIDPSLLEKDEKIFLNCTYPWFGTDCRFSLSIEHPVDSFQNLVLPSLNTKRLLENSGPVCYTHLNCSRPGVCLDWREICDRKVDCADRSDENHCWLLEINQCSANEFRCRNGQCIPLEFFNDGSDHPDCLDGSDEPAADLSMSRCATEISFRCEDYQCARSIFHLPCGDGQCVVPGSGSCDNARDRFPLKDPCAKAIACLMQLPMISKLQQFSEYCQTTQLMKIKEQRCPPMFQFPPIPVLFNQVRFLFTNRSISLAPNETLLPDYICLDSERCPNISWDMMKFNELTCVSSDIFNLSNASTYEQMLHQIQTRLLNCAGLFYEGLSCQHPTMYQCRDSPKCISKHRLMDGFQDCLLNDDEAILPEDILQYDLPERRPFFSMKLTKKPDEMRFDGCPIHFPHLCDGFNHLVPILIDGKNETDETTCHYWPCNTIYTRCDNVRACEDGTDEANCSLTHCPPLHHPCVFFNRTNKVSCLSGDRVGDGHLDCLGGTDERKWCGTESGKGHRFARFACRNTDMCLDYDELSKGRHTCPLADEKLFYGISKLQRDHICNLGAMRSEAQIFICNEMSRVSHLYKHFMLGTLRTHLWQNIIDRSPSNTTVSRETRTTGRRMFAMTNDEFDCHRGISIHVRLANQAQRSACLCPSTYYGDRCQYQNQRVSLSLRINTIEKRTSIFALVITLIDDDQNIESYEQIEHVPAVACEIKYHRHLLYATRPKNSSKIYSVRIDAFDKLSGQYRASWIYPILFPFLPVCRLSILLWMHHLTMRHSRDCTPSCVRGQCLRYFNAHHLSFCQCDPGWTGKQCHIPVPCRCASDAYCYSRSICICPVGRYGPRCYLRSQSAPSNYCLNGGTAIYLGMDHTHRHRKKTVCLCSKGLLGDRCERYQSDLQVGFHRSISVPSYLWLHFIHVGNRSDVHRSSFLHKLSVHETATFSFSVTDTFHLAFAQTLEHYYLILLRKEPIISANITALIHPSYRCLSIRELFNQTILNQHVLKRMKYYHLPCQKKDDLVCFYDQTHFCLCEQGGIANCFPFDHQLKFDCVSKNFCTNGGRCLIEQQRVCPRWMTCVCQDCYFGSQCQFSTKDAAFSLDVILGHHFHPHLSVGAQSKVVKFCIAIVTTLFVLGYLSNIGCLWTFQSAATLEIDGGRYLLASAITSLLILTGLLIKIWFLISWQLNLVTNRAFIHRQCILADYCLRLLVSSVDWFFALAAIERVFTVVRGIYFDRVKAKRIARRAISCIFLFASLTYLPDPLHRKIVEDPEEGRTWCIVDYSNSVRHYDRIVSMTHIFVPFIINIMSPVVIFVFVIHRQWNMRQAMTVKDIIATQYQIHRHRLLSPCILIIFNSLRAMMVLLSPCMKTARMPWFSIIGYFFSFLPATLIFIIYVLPSKNYREELMKSIKHSCAH